ncbi:hypothetical protein NHX12_017128, partial [Muraenolepis orangiensis]
PASLTVWPPCLWVKAGHLQLGPAPGVEPQLPGTQKGSPVRPPYDSVQVYGLEGSSSLAGSLRSLESEAGDKDDWGPGLEDWGPQFQSLAQLLKEREKEKEEEAQPD